jgi:hypothetical protein
MIQGVVNARHEAIVPLRVRGPGGIVSNVNAIVDSGYNSSLTLPATIVAALGLARQSSSSAVLADGSLCPPFDVFGAEEREQFHEEYDNNTLFSDKEISSRENQRTP